VVIQNLLWAQRDMERLKAENKMKLTYFHCLGALLGFCFLGGEHRTKIMSWWQPTTTFDNQTNSRGRLLLLCS